MCLWGQTWFYFKTFSTRWTIRSSHIENLYSINFRIKIINFYFFPAVHLLTDLPPPAHHGSPTSHRSFSLQLQVCTSKKCSIFLKLEIHAVLLRKKLPSNCRWSLPLTVSTVTLRTLLSILVFPHSDSQREGTGLLEYKAMPSLRDTARDGWFVYIYYLTAAGNSISTQLGSSCQSNRYGTEMAGGTARPSRTKSHLSGHSPPAN